MADKLSERLEREAASWDDWGNDHPGEHPVTTVRLLREAAELARRVEWRPIETAPKDGTRIMAANAHGAWMAEWRPVYVSGYQPENPWFSVMLNHDHIAREHRHVRPTHWMPLPEPPEVG